MTYKTYLSCFLNRITSLARDWQNLHSVGVQPVLFWIRCISNSLSLFQIDDSLIMDDRTKQHIKHKQPLQDFLASHCLSRQYIFSILKCGQPTCPVCHVPMSLRNSTTCPIPYRKLARADTSILMNCMDRYGHFNQILTNLDQKCS